jgi:hypothetical protein
VSWRWLVVAVCGVVSPPRSAASQTAFLRTDSVFSFTLRTNLRTLRGDRDTATSPWREATITWAGPDSLRTTPLRLRTRGAFRLRLCTFPPIRLRFAQDSVRGTPWHDLHRPKLVTHCMERAEYEQNVLQEYALYQVLRLLTPYSYPARLVRVTYEDAAGGQPVTHYGFVLEDPDQFAERVHGTPLTRTGIRQGEIHRPSAALLGVWEYFIANTDWSLPGLHNIALLRIDSVVHAVPYDFDWSGAINASYARPDPSLPIRSVRERMYRGLCVNAGELEPVLARFEALKDSIAAVYRSVPDLDPRTVTRTLAWYDEFYRAIADRRRFVQQAVARDCFRQ